MNEPNTNASTISAPSAGDQDLDQDAHARVVAGAGRGVGAQGVEAGDANRRARDGRARECRLRLLGLRLAGLETRLLRDVDERVRRPAVLGDEGLIGERARARHRRTHAVDRGVELRPDAGCVERRRPAGSVTTGTSGATSPPLP